MLSKDDEDGSARTTRRNPKPRFVVRSARGVLAHELRKSGKTAKQTMLFFMASMFSPNNIIRLQFVHGDVHD